MEISPVDLWSADQHMAELDGVTNEMLNQIAHDRIMGADDEVRLTFEVIGRVGNEFLDIAEERRYDALLAAHARALVRWSRKP